MNIENARFSVCLSVFIDVIVRLSDHRRNRAHTKLKSQQDELPNDDHGYNDNKTELTPNFCTSILSILFNPHQYWQSHHHCTSTEEVLCPDEGEDVEGGEHLLLVHDYSYRDQRKKPDWTMAIYEAFRISHGQNFFQITSGIPAVGKVIFYQVIP